MTTTAYATAAERAAAELRKEYERDIAALRIPTESEAWDFGETISQAVAATEKMHFRTMGLNWLEGSEKDEWRVSKEDIVALANVVHWLDYAVELFAQQRDLLRDTLNSAASTRASQEKLARRQAQAA
jgi:hypothetical protein